MGGVGGVHRLEASILLNQFSVSFEKTTVNLLHWDWTLHASPEPCSHLLSSSCVHPQKARFCSGPSSLARSLPQGSPVLLGLCHHGTG